MGSSSHLITPQPLHSGSFPITWTDTLQKSRCLRYNDSPSSLINQFWQHPPFISYLCLLQQSSHDDGWASVTSTPLLLKPTRRLWWAFLVVVLFWSALIWQTKTYCRVKSVNEFSAQETGLFKKQKSNLTIYINSLSNYSPVSVFPERFVFPNN